MARRSHGLAGIALHYLMLAPFIAFALFPLFWLIKVSVTPTALLYSEGVRMWPSATTLDNFRFVLTASDFPLFFRNSLIVSGATSFFTVIIAALCGYAFSRIGFRGKAVIVAFMLVTQMFPSSC